MDELKELAASAEHPLTCPVPGCNTVGEKLESVARHLALKHSKLDEFLGDQALVHEKRMVAMSKPKKVRKFFFIIDSINKKLKLYI